MKNYRTHLRFAVARSLAALFLLGLPTLCSLCFAQTPLESHATAAEERAQVRFFLDDWKRHDEHSEIDFERIKALGKRVLPLLDEFLLDKELGCFAQDAMARIDAKGAMPYLLKKFQNETTDIQTSTFLLANGLMRDYDAKAATLSGSVLSAGRSVSNEPPFSFQKEIHDAAVRRLQAVDSDADDVYDYVYCGAIQTLGLTGNRSDFPLLRKWAAKKGSLGQDCYHRLGVAALARLGDRQALDEISAELVKPVRTRPAQDFGNGKFESGTVVALQEDGQRFRDAAFQASFSMNPRFVIFLLRHLDDPPCQDFSGERERSPTSAAMEALNQIVDGKNPMQAGRSLKQWKQWGREHGIPVGK